LVKPNLSVAGTKNPAFPIHDSITFLESGVQNPDPIDDFLEAYGIHSWVYICVKSITDAIAGIRLEPYIQKSDGSWVIDTKHELMSILDSPNPYMGGYNLREYTAASMKLAGNAYWYLERMGTTKIHEIWPLLPDNVKAVSTKEKLIDHYIYDVGGKQIRLDLDEIIHFKSMNPTSLIYGKGPLSAAKTTVTTDIFAQVWNKSFFKNSAIPDFALETDTELKDETRRRILRSWEQNYKGVKNKGKVALLEAGLKFKSFGNQIKDMDFVNLRNQLRIEILSAFGVPPSVAGLLEFANYSNMKEQTKMFWTNTIIPLTRNIEQTLTSRSRQITFRPQTEFQFDLSKVEALRPDEQMRSTTARAYVGMGIPVNQVIDALDLPFEHVEGGDEPRQPFSPIALNQQAPETKKIDLTREEFRYAEWKQFDEALRARESRFQTAMRGFFRIQKKRVIKRLEDNAQALVAEPGERSYIWRLLKKALGGKTGQAFSIKAIKDTVEVIFDMRSENESLSNTSDRLIRGTYLDFATRMSNRVNPNFDFNLKDPVAEAWIDSKKFKLVREANGFTLEELTEEIVDAVEDAVRAGFSQSETIAEIKNRIEDTYEFAVGHRAERIARTEVIAASNAGNQNAMEQTGVERKQWLSARDGNVRDTHQPGSGAPGSTLDGQIVGTRGSFTSPSGAALSFPGDPSAPAGEIINCRCTTIPIVDE